MRTRGLDITTLRHLDAWLEREFREDGRDEERGRILDYMRTLTGWEVDDALARSWWEVRDAAQEVRRG